MLAKRDLIKGLLAAAGSASVASVFARDGSDATLCYAAVEELIAGFKVARFSPVDLLQAQIKRIEEYNPLVNAITYKHFDQAMGEAKASEERYQKGTERPLEGITVGIKDENDRKGWRVTQGSLVYKVVEPRPLQYESIAGWRIAYDWGARIDEPIPGMRSKMLEALKRLRDFGCIVEEVDCGFAADQIRPFQAGMMSSALGQMLLTAEKNKERLTPYVRQQLEGNYSTLGPAQAAAVDELGTKLHRQVQERVFLKGFQVLLMPTASTPFVKADTLASKKEVLVATGMKYPMTWPWNLLGRYPVVDVPIGLIEKNMPVGLQVIGNTFDDLTAFRFAYEWEKLTPRLFEEGRFPSFRSEP
jgi:Asp-tRNA(Asn)/Glu-tRNA(Gln) amidotransferase A subunit family amidase